MSDVAIYRMSHASKVVPGGQITALMKLCQEHLIKRLSAGWALTEKRQTEFPEECDDCRWERERKAHR